MPLGSATRSYVALRPWAAPVLGAAPKPLRSAYADLQEKAAAAQAAGAAARQTEAALFHARRGQGDVTPGDAQDAHFKAKRAAVDAAAEAVAAERALRDAIAAHRDEFLETLRANEAEAFSLVESAAAALRQAASEAAATGAVVAAMDAGADDPQKWSGATANLALPELDALAAKRPEALRAKRLADERKARQQAEREAADPRLVRR